MESYIFDLLMQNEHDINKCITKERYETLVNEADAILIIEQQRARYKRDKSVIVISNVYLSSLRQLLDSQTDKKGKSSPLTRTIGRKIQTLEMLIELLMEGESE